MICGFDYTIEDYLCLVCAINPRTNIIWVLPDWQSGESFSNFFGTKIKNIIYSLAYHSTSYF